MSGSLLFIRVVIRFFSNPSAKSICIPVFSRITFTTSVMGACSKSVPNRPCRPPTSQLFHDISIPEAWPVKKRPCIWEEESPVPIPIYPEASYLLQEFHPAYNWQKPDDHLSTPYLPYASAEGYATVPHGSSHIGSKLLLRHVIQSLVPYADKEFLHNIFRVVLVRNISIGYTAQP